MAKDQAPQQWESFEAMVRALFNRQHFLDGRINERATLAHVAMGLSGEAGEVLGIIKKVFANGRKLDYDRLIEEMGDVEFYLEALRQNTGVTREETIAANMRKLAKRYPGGNYSHALAKEKRDRNG